MRPNLRILAEGVRIAYTGLLANKLRTFLTLLGNIVGIMSVIAVVSLLGGIDTYMRQEVASEGSNVFTIQRVNFLEAIEDYETFTDKLLHNPDLKRDDVVALREQLRLASHVSGEAGGSARVSAYGKSIDGIRVSGRDAVYPLIEPLALAAGRNFTEIEDRENAPAAVIGWDVYESLIAPREAVGRTIRVGERHFKVVGVAAKRGRLLGASRDRFVIIPIGAHRKLFGNTSIDINVAAADVRQIDAAIEEATVAMRIRHNLGPRDDNDFAVSTSEQLIDLWRSISQGVMVSLVALVGISMVVGGIVLMNTMLVSVTERTREIGVRKAVGAPRGAIVWQFLVESATLSVFGGVIGMTVGFLIAATVSALSVLPYVVNPAIVVLALVVTVVIGLIFGTYPAVRAARLDPVEALRAE